MTPAAGKHLWCTRATGDLFLQQSQVLQRVTRAVTRGVTRSDGARGKKQVWRPLCLNLRSFGSKFTVLKKVLATLLGLFVATRSGSAPGQLCPFRYAAPVPNPTRCWILKSKNRLSMQWSSSRPAALSLRWSLFIERSSRDGATRRLQGVFDTQADTE